LTTLARNSAAYHGLTTLSKVYIILMITISHTLYAEVTTRQQLFSLSPGPLSTQSIHYFAFFYQQWYQNWCHNKEILSVHKFGKLWYYNFIGSPILIFGCQNLLGSRLVFGLFQIMLCEWWPQEPQTLEHFFPSDANFVLSSIISY